MFFASFSYNYSDFTGSYQPTLAGQGEPSAVSIRTLPANEPSKKLFT